jgi:hypothetical protein
MTPIGTPELVLLLVALGGMIAGATWAMIELKSREGERKAGCRIAQAAPKMSDRIPVRHTGSVIYFTFDALKIMVSSQGDCGRLPSLGRQGLGRVSPSVARAPVRPWSSKGGQSSLDFATRG